MPQILDPPGNLTVVELETATFSCLATGRPRPAIVWVQLSDMTLVQSSDFTIEGMEIGHRERRSNLTILSTQPSDAGAYSCVAVNEPGIDMDQATLTVHGENSCATSLGICTRVSDDFLSVSSVQWYQGSCSHQ